MTRRNATHYKSVKNEHGYRDVVAVVKSYGSLGPDPGRVESSTILVANVDRDYAEMLTRELTKRDHDASVFLRDNIFTIAASVGRQVDMWTGANSEWGERISLPIVY